MAPTMPEGLLRCMLLVRPQALNAKDGILRPAIALFLDLELLLPQSGKESVALLDSIKTEPLAGVHIGPIGILPQHVSDLPLRLRRRLLCPSTEIHVVLDLEPAD